MSQEPPEPKLMYNRIVGVIDEQPMDSIFKIIKVNIIREIHYRKMRRYGKRHVYVPRVGSGRWTCPVPRKYNESLEDYGKRLVELEEAKKRSGLLNTPPSENYDSDDRFQQ